MLRPMDLWRSAIVRRPALSVLRGDCALRAFSFDHLEPTDCRMVVTGADPAARIVRRISDRQFEVAVLAASTLAAVPLLL